MNGPPLARGLSLSIAAVERDTGLSKDTLRVWERRYGFPQPERDPTGERAYPLDQVERLRAIKRLMDGGHRPGRIVGLSMDELQQLSDASGPAGARVAAGAPPPLDLEPWLARIRSHAVDTLRGELLQAQARMGLGRFVTELLAPLNALVGERWMRGQLAIYEEHLYTEALQTVLRQILGALPLPPREVRQPLLLLGTVPNEPHGLGLLMAEALARMEGARVLSLGTQTPVAEIVQAAQALQVDVVALSFSAVLSPNQVVEALDELRQKLPRTVELWVGGSAPVLHRRPLPGVLALATLGDLTAALQRWRAQAAPA